MGFDLWGQLRRGRRKEKKKLIEIEAPKEDDEGEEGEKKYVEGETCIMQITCSERAGLGGGTKQREKQKKMEGGSGIADFLTLISFNFSFLFSDHR